MRFVLMFIYTLITLALSSRMALALDPENRVLVPSKPASGGRAPAEAGLESGRYQEVDQKDLGRWEKKRDELQEKDLKGALPRKSEGQDFPESSTSPKL